MKPSFFVNKASNIEESPLPGAFAHQKDGSDPGRVLLSGASGMLGTAITRALTSRGKRSVRLVRHAPHRNGELYWDPSANRLDLSELDSAGPFEAALHFSGANVSTRRWTSAYKREMRESRILSTRILSESLAKLSYHPKVLVTASAVGFYGDRGDEILDEDSPAGSGFFPELCSEWEAATRPAEDAGIRVVHLRFGVVLGPRGGALAQMLPLFRLGLGGRLGSGRQWMSWVSEADMVAAALFAFDHPSLAGAVNVTSPNPATNLELTRQLAAVLHRPAILPAPAFALRLAFGEMAEEALLASTRALPKRLLDAGFNFRYPVLADALRQALGSY